MLHLAKKLRAPKDGVAALPAVNRHANGAAFHGIERPYEVLDVPGGDQRHVAETDNRRRNAVRQRRQSALQRRAHTARMVRVAHQRHRQIGERCADLLGFVAGYDDHIRADGVQDRFHDTPNHRCAVHVGQQLVGRTHAAGGAGREHDCRRPGLRRRCRGGGLGEVALLAALADFLEQAARPHSHDVGAGYRQVGEIAPEHPVEPVQFGGTRATGHPDDRRVVPTADKQ